MNYKKLYYTLYNRITDAINVLEGDSEDCTEKITEGVSILKRVQIQTENMFIDGEEG